MFVRRPMRDAQRPSNFYFPSLPARAKNRNSARHFENGGMLMDASGRKIAYRISYLSQGRIACPAALGFWGIGVCLVACDCLTMIFGISVLDDTSGC